MKKLIAFRLALAVPQLALVSLLVFLLTYFVPGSAAAALLGTAATPERVAEVEAQLGLDRPFWERIAEWYAAAITGDLGTSWASGLPVLDSIIARLPATASLVGGALLVAIVVGISLGMIAGTKPGSFRDSLSTGITAVTLAIPEFWVGIVLLLIFAVELGWVPVVAYTPFSVDPLRWLQGLILPSLALGIGSAALIARQTRTAMAETMAARYVDTLTATGISRNRVITRYGLKNAMIPVLAATGITVSIIIGGSFVMEKVFSFPGIGDLMLSAVSRKDIPMIQGVTLFIAVTVIIVNLLVDIGYGLLNPKARPA
jgi:peptide/nickel transport system permease protein